MEVRYHPAFAAFMIGTSLFILVSGLFLGAAHLMFLGALNLTIGVLAATRPMYVVHDGRVEVRNLFGMTMKTHEFASLADLEVEGNWIRRKADAEHLAGGMLMNPTDVAAVKAAVDAAHGKAA